MYFKVTNHMVICIIALIVYAAVMVDTTIEYVSNLHDREIINLTYLKNFVISHDLNSSDALASLIKPAVSDEDNSAEGVIITVLSHCDDLAHSDDGGNDDDDDDENEVVIQPSRFELLVLGAIIATFAVVLLLVTCLLVIILNKSSGGAAIVFEYEPSKCVSQTGPVIRSKAGVEDVTLSRETSAPPRQVSKKKVSKSCTKILFKLSESIQINRRLIKLLITIASDTLKSKASTKSLENELVELQKNMSKVQKDNNRLKSHAQRFKLKSDHHRRQECYLEDRCEELKKHNEYLINIFKTINKQKTPNHGDEALTDEEYPVQEENACHSS